MTDIANLDKWRTLETIAKKGKAMREAQKAFYKNGQRQQLIAAKDLEAAFDLLITRYFETDLFTPRAG